METQFDFEKLNDEYPLTKKYELTGIVGLNSFELVKFAKSRKLEDSHPCFVFENDYEKQHFEGLKRFSTRILELVRDEPISFFAEIKECYFITESTRNRIDNRLLDLASWAYLLDIPFRFYRKKQEQYREISVMEEVQNRLLYILEERDLKIIHPSSITISGDYGSSGLWTKDGMIPYDMLDLPFELVQRLTIWAESYWHFLEGPCSQEWCLAYEWLQEQLANELRTVLGIEVDSIP